MKPTLRPAEDLGEVFQAHQAELVRLAAFILGDRGAGEDVVQDVFVRVHQRERPLDGDLLPYLRAAVVNCCRSAIRRRLLIRRHAERHSPCPPLTVEEFRGVVQPGNSGGPLLSPGGTVDGVVDSPVAGVADTAFVLTASEVQPDASAGSQATAPVSTQGCMPGR